MTITINIIIQKFMNYFSVFVKTLKTYIFCSMKPIVK